MGGRGAGGMGTLGAGELAAQGQQRLHEVVLGLQHLLGAYARAASASPSPAETVAAAAQAYSTASLRLRHTLQQLQDASQTAQEDGDDDPEEAKVQNAQIQDLQQQIADRNTMIKAAIDKLTACVDTLAMWREND